MLVLSRKAGEQIVIGQDIVVRIVRIASGRVRVGIDAPLHVPVRRAEVPVPAKDEMPQEAK